jgi:hypothetical protein
MSGLLKADAHRSAAEFVEVSFLGVISTAICPKPQ